MENKLNINKGIKKNMKIKKRAIIVDIDGTLALMGGIRTPHEYDKVHLDKPNKPIIDLVHLMYNANKHKDLTIFIFTGRMNVSFEEPVLIDTDNDVTTGYHIPGIGADNLVEIYGKNQAIYSSMLYSFNDNRERNDWNAFFLLSTINARASGTVVEAQVPLFDLGASNEDEMKLVWQTSDNNEMTDLADNIFRLSEERSSISENINSQVDNSNTVNEGTGIVIDGYFADWLEINKDSLDVDSQKRINKNPLRILDYKNVQTKKIL